MHYSACIKINGYMHRFLEPPLHSLHFINLLSESIQLVITKCTLRGVIRHPQHTTLYSNINSFNGALSRTIKPELILCVFIATQMYLCGSGQNCKWGVVKKGALALI